ncbi:MAG: hypothetical protein HY002_20490 [Candidatus Rokubacteria bacterium]|nr:hypothetical protein [Candidatus Rokubacteria bacterium]
MKIYTTDWHTWYGLDYAEAAEQLRTLGVSFAFVLNSVDSAPVSGTPSRVADHYRDRARSYSDHALREALRHVGIRYYAAFSMFFDPTHLRHHPELAPINVLGDPMQQVGWYVGLCPSSEDYLRHKIRVIQRVARELEPDGIFLTVIRFPGFWERWIAGYQRSPSDEYCFCTRCLDRFSAETGIQVERRIEPGNGRLRWLTTYRSEWTEWKCKVITDVVARVRRAASESHPHCDLVLNTVPFRTGDFGNAIEEVLGQHRRQLAPLVDAFELMTYHQVLKRQPSFITEVGNEARIQTAKPIYCTVFTRPRYLDGVYKQDGRHPSITAGEVAAVLEAVAASQADGVVLRWEDYLEDLRATDNTKLRVLHSGLARLLTAPPRR